VTDFPDWQQPDATAQRVAVRGVPLLRNTNQLGTASGQVMAANTMTTLLPLTTITQPGYEGTMVYNMAAGVGTNPFAKVTLQWSDSATGNIAYSETFFITAGNGPANALSFYMTGPCYGNALTVFFTNLDPTNTATLSWVINQTSHLYLHSRVRQGTYAGTAPNGFINPNGAPGSNVIAQSHPSIGPNVTTDRLMAVYDVRVNMMVDNGAQANGVNVIIVDPGGFFGGGAGAEFTFTAVAAGARAQVQLWLPRAPMILRMVNIAGTNTISPQIALVTADY
jgi:hypothetical protein